MKVSLTIITITSLLAACSGQHSPSESKAEFQSSKTFDAIGKETISQSDRSALLVGVKPTIRISSNHYADFVIDREGNSYIACFQKKEDNHDYIIITKVSPSGKVLWEKGNFYQGRATSISIDQQEGIWVTGFFENKLAFDEKAIQISGSSIFIANFDKNGKCLKLLHSRGNGVSTDINVNNQGAILLGGVMRKEVWFGKVSLKKKSTDQTGFLAFFDQDGVCREIRELNGSISRIKSDQVGDFYVAGSFNLTLNYQKESIVTQSSFDNDGFLLKVSPAGKKYWLRQFGAKGFEKYGYRTNEKAADIALGVNNRIVVCGLVNSNASTFTSFPPGDVSNLDLVLLEFNTEGTLVAEKIIAKNVVGGSVYCLLFDHLNHLWLSGTAGERLDLVDKQINLSQASNSFLIKLNAAKEIDKIILPKHNEGMLFRAAFSKGNYLGFTGHYQGSLKIDDQHIHNKGNHELFLFLQRI